MRRVRTTVLLLATMLAAAACASGGPRDPYRRAIPVYEEVEVPVCERRPQPRVRIRFVPEYEEVVETVVGEGGLGRERRCRRLVGYRPEEIPIGCTWESVQTGTETVRRLVGWRWPEDPPWPCEVEAFRRKAAAAPDGEAEAEAVGDAGRDGAATEGPKAAVPRQGGDAAGREEAVDVESLPSLDDLPGLEEAAPPGE